MRNRIIGALIILIGGCIFINAIGWFAQWITDTPVTLFSIYSDLIVDYSRLWVHAQLHVEKASYIFQVFIALLPLIGALVFLFEKEGPLH